MEGQHFRGILVVHMFLCEFHVLQVDLIHDVLEGIPTHSADNEELVIDQIHGVAPEIRDEYVLDQILLNNY